MTKHPEVDVRDLPPRKRHEKLLEKFANMEAGDGFVLVNDHDPEPLYHELRSIHGDVVGWEYLKEEGNEWKVDITRNRPDAEGRSANVVTLLDLDDIEDRDDRIHSVAHRFSMLTEGETMELFSSQSPASVKQALQERFGDELTWDEYRKVDEDAVLVRAQKTAGQTEEEETTGGDDEEADLDVVREFDVREHPPAKRHEMIYDAYEELSPGEAFAFTNDHDPKPLYFQFESEEGEAFDWTYLMEGGNEWKVRIGRVSDPEDPDQNMGG